jgi:RNA polymerase sigma-70 factor, ECF subfamily
VAKKMIFDGDEVSDIIQDIFVDYFTKLKKGEVIHNPKNWLYRATFNKCIDYLRRKKKFQRLDSSIDFETEGHHFDKYENNVVINLAISKLKEKEKELIILYSEGMTYKEISQVTQIHFFSIGKMISRTLKKLEKELKRQGYEMY